MITAEYKAPSAGSIRRPGKEDPMSLGLGTEERRRVSSGIASRLQELELRLDELLSSPIIRFDEGCRRGLPGKHGVYRIFQLAQPDHTVRAGRTKTAAGGLRQRVYQNHLMGDQAGNLRAQLVNDGAVVDLVSAKQMIRERYGVQVLVIEDSVERAWFEHFMLGVLRPSYCD